VSGLDVWILDALRPMPHPSHLSLGQALDLVALRTPKQAVLTNLHIDLDYAATERDTPENVTPAYDGMRIDISAGRIMR
jgi:phosphoribosyl 1,2-cyclic phosphate phosphodiesterase